MSAITKDIPRPIIEDFAKEIRERKLSTAKPSKEVINFRTDIRIGFEREVFQIPIGILRYRKDNGRIASDVADFERTVRPLNEANQEDQDILAKFLAEKDPDKTKALRSSILHAGQREPSIITCDGFLINGNRRKMVMDRLHEEHPQDALFGFMKAVILPGKGEEGGPPTLLEIEQIENRYQLQSDGKAEYYGFDKALSIRRKQHIGLSLREQLLDDPLYAGANDAELKKAELQMERDFLEPLKCVDRYLKQFAREGQYRTVSAGISDREGRWQAFIDYSNTLSRVFKNPAKLLEYEIEESKIGAIEEAAFDIIRLRTIPDMPKVHDIMRDLPKYCRTKEGKKSILKIADEVEPSLPTSECFDKSGNPLKPEEVDAKWAARNKQVIIHQVKKAALCHDTKRERETPLELMEAAYKKLTHDDMDLDSIALSDLGKALKIAMKIKDTANELATEIYQKKKNWKNLQRGSQ
jgi:hypothetical protein